MQKLSSLVNINSNMTQTTTVTTPEMTEISSSNVNQENMSPIDQEENQSNNQVCKYENGTY